MRRVYFSAPLTVCQSLHLSRVDRVDIAGARRQVPLSVSKIVLSASSSL